MRSNRHTRLYSMNIESKLQLESDALKISRGHCSSPYCPPTMRWSARKDGVRVKNTRLRAQSGILHRSHSGYFCPCVCQIATTNAGETNRRWCQTNPVLTTALALLDLWDIITILRFPVLEQLLAQMRIAGVLNQNWCACSTSITSQR